jgi:hypothetical protein
MQQELAEMRKSGNSKLSMQALNQTAAEVRQELDQLKAQNPILIGRG